MKKTLIFLLLLSFIISTITLGQSKNDEFYLYFLGGQSNMEGQGYNSELPKSLNKKFKDVWIFQGYPKGDGSEEGGLGIWDILQPGFGSGFYSDGNTNSLSERFGAELSFAARLKELYPDRKIAIIKYARGGSSIDSAAARYFGSWEPDFKSKNGINQYDYFFKTVNKALSGSDLDNNKKPDVFIPRGIIWMQGESDAAITEEIAARYYDNLKRLMDLIRAAFRVDDLPIVIGKISDSWNDEGEKDGKVWNYGELVQWGQEKFVRTDVNSAIVRTTRYYKYSDPWHYDSEGYIDLGKQFADEIYKLNK